MQVIPSINVSDFEQAKEQIKKATEFSDYIHIDVADGIFTPNVSWGSPSEFLELGIRNKELRDLKTEVHLMVESPDAVVLPWLEAGVKRIIVQVESVEEPDALIEICRDFSIKIATPRHNEARNDGGVEFGLAISPETPVEELNIYLNRVNFYQVLAVDPGLTGQKFNKSVLEKIKFLRQQAPHAIIEVDGGINPETVKWCHEAGADIVVSASYIWQDDNPSEKYKDLLKV